MSRNYADEAIHLLTLGLVYIAIVLAALACVAVVFFVASDAHAHQAPSGWSYPGECCSTTDCNELPRSAVHEGPSFITIRVTPDQHDMVREPQMWKVRYGDSRIRPSPDGEYHVCIAPVWRFDEHDDRLLCLFVPPRGF